MTVTALRPAAVGVRLDSIERGVAQLAAGRPVVVLDDESRENEGDLILAAELATPEWIAFLVRHTSGFLCVALTEADAERLELPPMTAVNEDPRSTAYTVTVDARTGISTGISAVDRARTVRLLADPQTDAAELSRPGHVVPLRAREGGVLERTGHTEAAIDLARLAGLSPAGVLSEIVSERDPTGMARAEELRDFADQHGLALISIADLVAFRRRAELPVERVGSTRIPLIEGEFRAIGYRVAGDPREHVAFAYGDLAADPDPALVHIHIECLTGDAFGSLRCDCARQLHLALQAVADRGRGVVMYLRGSELAGVGLLTQLVSYQAQDYGCDSGVTVAGRHQAIDSRDRLISENILSDLGITHTAPVSFAPPAVNSMLTA